MASSSTTTKRHSATTPVIDYGPNPAPFRYERRTRQWVAWPFWAFKVNVELPSRRQFNLLERFVLKASFGGARTTGRIAGTLELDEELVEFIVDDLKARQFLDEELTVTERGEQALGEDEERQPEIVSGHVFTDAISGRLWPRFVQGKLEHCDAEIIQGGGAEVQTGTVGNPYTAHCFVVWPQKMPDVSSTPTDAPGSFAVGDAIRGGLKAQRDFERFALDDETRRAAGHFDRGLDAKNARLVDGQPRPYFVTTYVHMPEDLQRSSAWQVCDPFGLGLSGRLRKTIGESIEDGDWLLKERVVEEAIGGTYEVDDTELADLMMARYEEAAAGVDERYEGCWIPDEVRLKLYQMEHAFVDAREALDSSGESIAEADRQVRAFLRGAQAGLEELFAKLLSRHLDSGEQSVSLLSKLSRSSSANEHLLTEVADELGFVVDDSSREVLSVQHSRAQGVIECGNRELLTSFAVLVLQAGSRIDHELRFLAGQFPDVATFLAELRAARGAANHASQHRTDPGRRLSVQELEGYREDVLHIFHALSPKAPDREEISSLTQPGNEWDAELMCRLRAGAAREVRDRVGDSLNDKPVLNGRLVEAVQCAREIEGLVAQLEGDEASALSRRLQDLAFAANSACEAVAGELVGCLPACEMPERFSDNRKQNRLVLVGITKSFNFRFDAGHENAETLLMVNPHRLRRAVEQGEGSLNSLTWAALIRAYCADGQVTDILGEIASEHPRFLDDMAWVSTARGHGNKVEIDTDDAPELLDAVFRQVKTVLSTIQ